MDVNILEVYSFMEVSSFQGVGIEEFHCIQRYPHFREKFHYTEVSPFQGVGIEEFHCIQRFLHFKGLEQRGILLYSASCIIHRIRVFSYRIMIRWSFRPHQST